MADTKINPKPSFLSKHKKTIVIVIVVAIILLLAVSYFGVLSPSRFLSSGDSGYYETRSLSLEVKHGDFEEAESTLKAAVSEFGAKIYRETINEYGGRKTGSFTIDVPENAADNLVNKLRTIGDVKSYRYSKGMSKSTYGTDGLQEGYVRITVSLTEQQSVFSSFDSLKGNALGSTFSGSIVALFYFIIAVLPWVLAILLIYLLVRYIKRKL